MVPWVAPLNFVADIHEMVAALQNLYIPARASASLHDGPDLHALMNIETSFLTENYVL